VTYREFFSHVVDVVEAVGATILVVGGLGAFARCGFQLVVRRGQDTFGDLRKNLVSALIESRAFCSSKVAVEGVLRGEVSDACVRAARAGR